VLYSLVHANGVLPDMHTYILFAIPPSFVGLAAVLAVIRANKDDLPSIVRALMRVGPRDDKRDDDDGKPPSLPKP
jgi:hypothetical protein